MFHIFGTILGAFTTPATPILLLLNLVCENVTCVRYNRKKNTLNVKICDSDENFF